MGTMGPAREREDVSPGAAGRIGARARGADVDPSMRDWLAAMPKAELHLHLDGSLRPATALELVLERAGRRLPWWPGDLPRDLAAVRAHLVAPERCADQAELLRAFDLPVALLQDAEAIERAARELAGDVAAEGTRYAEVRWAPSLHTAGGLTLAEGIAAVVAGSAAGARASGIVVRLIAVAIRTQDPGTAVEVARAAAAFRADGVVGFDLAGREREAPDPTRFAEAFAEARARGLAVTCHAGEWGGASQVRRALAMRPARIAHGAPAADDPALVAELRARGVVLDLCPTSNVQAGVVADLAAHPLPRLLRAGVRVTLSTDDRTVSDTMLVDELARAMAVMGLRPPEVLRLVREAWLAAFLDAEEPLRARLLADFDRWAARHPAPGAGAPDA
jgi:adenosine deaminase